MRLSHEFNWLLAIAATIACIYFLGPVLPPFVAGFIIAYLGDPLVRLLMRLNVSRTFSATIVFLFFIAIIIFVILLIVPVLQEQITLLIEKIPSVIMWLQQTLIPWINAHLRLNESIKPDAITKAITDNLQQTSGVLMSLWRTVSHSGLVFIEKIVGLLLIPVVTFYLLRDWHKVWANLRELLPKTIQKRATQFAREADEVLGAFLRGQLLVIISLSIIYSIGLSIAGLQFAILIGVISGIINIIPYLGVIIGLSTASLMMLYQFHDWTHVLYAVIVYAIGTILDNSVLTPILVGDKIGLHPVAVIFSILVGGHLFGLVGVLLALPAASIIMVLQRHLRAYMKHD